MLYTQYARSHDKTGLSYASNIAPPSYNEPATYSNSYDEKKEVTTTEHQLDASIAILPQYIAKETVTLTIREVSFPHLSDSFTVSESGNEILSVNRERPALGWRQTIRDTKANTSLMTLRRNFGQIPISYSCFDPNETKVLDLQGNFSVPFSGAKSSAFLLNAETGEHLELSMHGSHRNRHATIKNATTQEVLVSMESDIFEARNIVGGRRTYTVTIKAGVDRVLAVAMIMALDARAD